MSVVTVALHGGRRQALRHLTNVVLLLAFLAFAAANFNSWRRTGHSSGLGATVLEGWAAALFLVRRDPREVSRNWLAWIAAPVGSFAMLLARPVVGSGTLALAGGEIAQLLGLALAFASLGTLGRSFGLVAANRGVKTSGPYRLVRHPTYAAYLLAYCGYVLESPSARNVALLCLGTAFQLVRIEQEERLLDRDPGYRRYCQRVRFRLLPHVY